MNRLKIYTIIYLFFLLSTHAWAWTTDNHEWENGDTIIWDVPYQTQSTFRNWTTACMPTSGAMIVNFFYAGARILNFNDIHGNDHPWDLMIVNNSYQTTGQRIYALGIIAGNSGAFSLSNYLKNYPKNGIDHFYCILSEGCVNANYGPLHNERFSRIQHTSASFTNTNDYTGGYISSLKSYLSIKHLIEMDEIPNTTSSIRNALYYGPVIISVSYLKASHIVIVKGVNNDGNLIINDPWGASIVNTYPGNDGNGKVYTVVNNTCINAYNESYTIGYAYSLTVMDNYQRDISPFSPFNIPVEANIIFNYDASGQFNDAYNGDGNYAHIRNGFNYWNSSEAEWKYTYSQPSACAFPYVSTTKSVKETAAARWTPYLIREGQYEVLAGFFPHNSNTSEANYIIYHKNGENRVIINQKNNDDAFEVRGNIVYKSLGTYSFNMGENRDEGSVKIINTSNVEGDINVDIVRFLFLGEIETANDAWHGNGSIISYHDQYINSDPGGSYPYGCKKDSVQIHSIDSEKPVAFFQWQTMANECQNLKISAPELSFSNRFVDITIGEWNRRDKDITFSNVFLPFIIGPGNTGFSMSDASWYTIKVVFKTATLSDSLLNAECTNASPTLSTYQKQQNSHQLIDGGYQWNGTGSIVSYNYRELKGKSLPNDFPYGCFTDVTKVHPSSEKPVIFFQWQTWEDSCQDLQIKAPLLPVREKRVAITIGPWDTREADVTFPNVTLPFTITKENTRLQFQDGGFYTIKIEFQQPVTQLARVYANCPDELLATVSTQRTRSRNSSGLKVPKASIEDNIKPSLSISNPQSGAVIFKDATCVISFVGTDNVGISSYKVEFSTDNGNSYSILKSNISSTINRYSWTPTQSTNQGKLKMTAYDAAGNHSIVYRSITVKTTSTIPEESVPDNPRVYEPGVETPYGIYTLSWSSLDNADYYVVKETVNNIENEMIVYKRTIQFTKSENGTYYYRVKGVNNVGDGNWGGPVDMIVNITPNEPPTAPHQPTPYNGTKDRKINNIYFRWFSHDKDKRQDPKFQFLLGTNQDQLRIVRDYDKIDSQNDSYTHPGPLQYETTYYWQVKVMDDRGAEVSGPVWTFETAQKLSFDSPVYSDKTNEMIPHISNYAISVGVVDIDQDGDLDIYEVDNTPDNHEPSIWIYTNDSAGVFTHHAETGLPKGLRGAGASWADYDNDGDKDVIIWFHHSSPKLFQNNGDILFSEVTSNAGLSFSTSPGLNTCSWGDIENDDDMDLYCSCDEKLFKNNGNGTFTDISDSCGFSEPGNQFPSSSCWADINKDGNIDLLTVGMSSGIYKNLGDAKFEKTTFGGLTPRDFLSLSIGDYNNDGLPDIFLSSGGGSSLANPDRLLENQGNLKFKNVTSISGLPDNQTSNEATTWLDYDNDGWLDLAAASNLFRNMGDSTFTKVTGSIGLNLLNSVYGVFAFDVNNDGAQDLYYGTLNQNQIYVNEQPVRNWVKVKLQGVQTNKHGYGAEIRVTTTDSQTYRYPATCVGYGEQESSVQHFGVNTATKVDVRVAWPGGIIDERFNLDVNQEIEILEGLYQDKTQPGNITNLVAISDSESSVMLAWTAPGDDDWLRKANAYECRWFYAPIDVTNWENAYSVSDAPEPLEPFVRQHWKIEAFLPDTLYYFAIKTYDEAGNVSELSNIAQVRTLLGDKLLAFAGTPFGGNQVQLTWKVPNVLISAYDIRYSDSWINESNFEQANTISDPPIPEYPGNIQSVDISNLKSNTTYYFAIKMILPDNSKSSVSTVLSVKTLSPVNNTNIINSTPFFIQRQGYTPLMAGDLNGDGKPDGVFTTSAYIENEHRYRVTVHFSMNGTLNAIPDITISNNNFRFASGQSVAISDLNNDGADDLIIGFHRDGLSNQGQVFIYLGGSGMNTVADYVMSGSNSESRFGQAIIGNADFNHDAIDDLLIYERGQLLMYFGGNDFDSNPDHQIPYTDPGTSDVYLAPGDFNGDNKTDLVAQYSNQKLAFFISGDNGFDLPVPTLEKLSLYPTYPIIGDFDGNGCDDLAMIVSSKNVHILMVSNTIDWSTAESYTIMENISWDNANMVSMDFNGDGIDDLIVGHGDDQTYFDGVARVYLGGNYFDNIADKELSFEGYVDFGHYLLSLGDLNGDTIDDLLIASEYDDMIVIAGGAIDVKNDTTAPSTVTDLSAISEKVGQATISWTAPGDDGNNGKSLQYDIIQTLYKNNFHSIWGTRSVPISNIPLPSVSGTTESCVVENLIPGLTYRFILRTWDDAGNLSERSNIAVVEIKTGYEFEKKFSYDEVNLTSTGCSSNNGLHSGYNTGDINGDGIDDFLIEGGAECGRLRIFYGNALFEAYPDFDISGNDFRTEDLNGVGGCPVNQINGAYPLGDFNNDGKNDFYTYYSCYYTEAFYTGSSNLFFVNPSGKLHDDWEDFERVGDVNGDGYEDFVALDLKFYSTGYPDIKAGIFLGGPTFKNTPDIVLYDAPDFYTIRGIGDFNGDGFDDIAIGMSPSSKYENGDFQYYGESRVKIYLGSSNMDNTPDIVLTPNERDIKHSYNKIYACNFGRTIEGIGDYNGDGFNDLAVSASESEENSSNQGIVYIYLGCQGNVSGDPDITIFGPPGGSDFGEELYSVGDLNGDGFSDFIIGGLEYVTNESGKVRLIYFGGTNPSTTAIHAIPERNTSINETFYNREHHLGIDFNKDGKSEIIWKGTTASSTGSFYLVELIEKDSDNDSIPDNEDEYIFHAPLKEPQLQFPDLNSNSIDLKDVFTWIVDQSLDQDLRFDLYLGLSEEPALYTNGLTINQYDCSDQPLQYNTYYYWKVVVRDSVGQTASSEIRSFITRAPPVPEKPLNLMAESREIGISLSWKLPGTGIPIDHIIIERAKMDENIWHIIDTTENGFSENYIDTYHIQPNQSYKYRIAFQNVTGQSDYSPGIEATGYNLPPILLDPGNIIFEAGEVNFFKVSAENIYGDGIFFQLLDAPNGMSIDIVTGIIQWLPKADQMGLQTLIINVSDSFGANNSKEVSLTVQDTTPPVIIPPQDISINVSDTPTNIYIGNATASDFVTPKDFIIISNDAPVTGFSSGETIVTWYAVDEEGNTGNAQQKVTVKNFTLDIDGHGEADALTDGLVIIRFLFGLEGNSLVKNVVKKNSPRSTSEDILIFLNQGISFLDVDDNNKTDALTDGLLIIRYLFGLKGQSLINNAVDKREGNRLTSQEIEGYLKSLMP